MRITLEELAQKPYPILLDASAICGKQTKYIREIKGKFTVYEKNCNYLILIKEYIENGSNFYIRPMICEELQAGEQYSFKKIIKRIGACDNRKLLELSRKIRDTKKEGNRLVGAFRDYGRIFQLNEREQNLYENFEKKYLFLIEKHGLSKPDFDFTISGISRAKKTGPILLVSNDYGIKRAFQDILKNEYICYRIQFFERKGFLDFEKVEGLDNFKIMHKKI